MPRFVGSVIGKGTHRANVPDSSLPLPYAKVGIEVEVENWDGRDLQSSCWVGKEDHSLRGRSREFVTDGGMIGADISKAVNEMCKECNDRGFSVGYPRAGIHVHVDVTDLDLSKEDLARFISNYLILEHIFFGFAGEWRTWCCYTVPMNSTGADFASIANSLFNDKVTDHQFYALLERCSKYQALNVEPITRFGTVEFRHLPTTFDPNRIMTWIKMILAVKRYSMEQTEQPLKTLSRLGVHEYVRGVLGEELYLLLSPLVDPASVWMAVDNAQLLLSLAGRLTPPAADWARLSTDPNPIMLSKLEKIKKYRERRKSNKADSSSDDEEYI